MRTDHSDYAPLAQQSSTGSLTFDDMGARPSVSFSQWARAGYASDLLPIIPPGAVGHLDKPLTNAGKMPGVKRDDGAWVGLRDWSERRTDPEELSSWQAMGAGIGLRLGNAFLLDIDITDPAASAEVVEIAKRILGRAPMRTGRAPKRALLYRRASEGVRAGILGTLKIDGVSHRIEIPRQAVVDGVHPVTGLPYTWDERRKLDNLARVSEDELERFLTELEVVFGRDFRRAAGIGDERPEPATDALRCPEYRLDWLADLVRQTPNSAEHFPDYPTMRDMVWAIQGAFADDEQDRGYELAREWAEKWPEFSEGDFEAIWRYSSKRLGCRQLLTNIERALPPPSGGSWQAYLWFEPLGDADIGPVSEAENAKDETGTFELLDLSSVEQTSSFDVPYLVKGLLPRHGLTVLYGQSGAGKTFVAFDIAHSVASGRPWASRRTTPGNILYVAAEGASGIRRRLMALQRSFNDRPLRPGSFQLLSSTVDLFSSDRDLEKLIATALRAKAELIVIDTLSRVLAGGDENASTDLGKVVMRLERIRERTGAHVLVVHHSGKDESRGARGHSLLRAALDTEIEVAGGAIKATKQRDMDDTFSVFFKLRPIRLGRDQDGDPVTSCVVEILTEPEAPSVDALSRVQGEVMAIAMEVGADGRRFRVSDLVEGRRDGSALDYEKIRSAMKQLEKKRLVDRVSPGTFKIPGKMALPGGVLEGDRPGNSGQETGK